MRYGNTPMEWRQESEDSCIANEDRSFALDESELNASGQECIEALQAGLDAVYSALTGGDSIAEAERERRERMRDCGD